MNTYEISKFVFYEQNNYNYLNGLRMNTMPRGPLKNYIKKISKPKLSPFESFYEVANQEQRCYYQIYNMENPSQPLLENNISVLFNFLLLNNYTINTDITKIMKKNTPNLICYINYT